MLRVNTHGLMESFLLPVGVVVFGFLLHAEDPLFLHASYPWVWLLPVLIALRYGLFNAGLSIALYIVAIYYTIYHGFFDWQSYRLWFLGGLIGTLVSAEYHAYWKNKLGTQNARSEHLHKRLESLSRAYSTMRISHDRLEEALIVKPVTLRGALTDLRNCMRASDGQFNQTSSTQFMAILANSASLNKAALYLFEGKKLNENPTAYVGRSETLNLTDRLVTRCLKERETVYVSVNELEVNEASDYLAVIPMQTADGHLLGLLTISDLPFIAMTDETLKIVSLLVAYVADGAFAERHATAMTHIYPDCPPFFGTELLKCYQLYQKFKIDSALITFHILNETLSNPILQHLRQTARGLDVLWERHEPSPTLIVLMPLSSHSMIEGYLNRINDSLNKAYGVSCNNRDIQVSRQFISHFTSLETLLQAFHRDE